MQWLTDLLVAYLTGVLPVHGVDGGSRVHVHQVVVVVAGHHPAAPVVELHGYAGVCGDGPHGVGVVGAPPCDPEAGPPEGGRRGARRLPSRPPSPRPAPAQSSAPPQCVDLAARPDVHWRQLWVVCWQRAGHHHCQHLGHSGPAPGGCRPVGSRHTESPRHVRRSGQPGAHLNPPLAPLATPGRRVLAWPLSCHHI